MNPILNILLWIAQAALAFVFFKSGYSKVFHYVKFLAAAPGMASLSESLVKFIGTCEILGAIAVVIPWLIGVFPMLTPIAALGLATIMLLAIGFHLKRGETKALGMPVGLLVLALFVTWGRWIFTY